MRAHSEGMQAIIDSLGLSTPLAEAAALGDVNEVRRLISQGADVCLGMLISYERLNSEDGLKLIERLFWEMLLEGKLPAQLKCATPEKPD